VRLLRDFASCFCASWVLNCCTFLAQLSYSLASLFSFGLFFPFLFLGGGVLEECSLQRFWVVFLCLPVLFSGL
jgi:hypothetical protein